MKKELIHTLSKKEAIDAVIGIGEVGLDSFLESGLAKDIPIIGTLVKLSEFGLNISDYMFIKTKQGGQVFILGNSLVLFLGLNFKMQKARKQD